MRAECRYRPTGVALVYNRYGYGPEKREALENWCNHLEALEASDAPLFEDQGAGV